jgi:hypothetical protein
MQHLSYLAETDDINKLHYVFDDLKFDNLDAIKQQFQKLYQKNADDVFDVIWNNQNLRSSLFGNEISNITDMNIAKQISKQSFNSKINDINNNIYKFIKAE